MKPNSPPTPTPAVGTPMANGRNTVAAGPRGPVFFDYQPREKMGRFNCERVVHARGTGAYAKFTVTRVS